MPSPGKLPLKRFHREKGPEYRHASLCKVNYTFRVYKYVVSPYYLLHGSFAGCPDAAASFFGSKPVRFDGAIVAVRTCQLFNSN